MKKGNDIENFHDLNVRTQDLKQIRKRERQLICSSESNSLTTKCSQTAEDPNQILGGRHASAGWLSR